MQFTRVNCGNGWGKCRESLGTAGNPRPSRPWRRDGSGETLAEAPCGPIGMKSPDGLTREILRAAGVP